jgi:hypothetical protein
MDSSSVSTLARKPAHRLVYGKWTIPTRPLTYREMFFRTRVIVRLGLQNRMVTKGYRKGVYEWVTLRNFI